MKMIALIIISIANLTCGTAVILWCDGYKQFSPSSVFLSMFLFEFLVAATLFPGSF